METELFEGVREKGFRKVEQKRWGLYLVVSLLKLKRAPSEQDLCVKPGMTPQLGTMFL